jgi:two-component system OmpR family sensor kinase
VRVDRSRVALAELVDGCIATHAQAALARRVRFENHVSPSLVLESDREKLRLVVANLVSNAAEYTSEGGWVAVESDPARGVLIAVRDSGPPIPDALAERLFDPFFRLDHARSGGEHCGIGLSVARGVCDALGYRIAASNEAGGVVAFTITASDLSYAHDERLELAAERAAGRGLASLG